MAKAKPKKTKPKKGPVKIISLEEWERINRDPKSAKKLAQPIHVGPRDPMAPTFVPYE